MLLHLKRAATFIALLFVFLCHSLITRRCRNSNLLFRKNLSDFFLYVQETPEMMNVSAVGGEYYTTSSDYENRIRHSSKQVEELEERLR